MKKIGILFGQESSFPQAFVDRVNEKNIKGISAEFVTVDEVFQGRATDYAVYSCYEQSVLVECR